RAAAVPVHVRRQHRGRGRAPTTADPLLVRAMSKAPAIERTARRDWVGDSLTWLSGGALAAQILLVIGLIGLLAWHGSSYLWQDPVVELRLDDGSRVAGEVQAQEVIVDHEHGGRQIGRREKLKVGNQDVTGQPFRWVDESRVKERALPEDLVLIERTENGNFYG